LFVTTTTDLNRLIALQEEPATLGDGSSERSDVESEDDGAPTVSDSSFDINRAAPFEDQAVAYRGDLAPAEHDLVEVARTEDQSSSANAEYEGIDPSANVFPFPAESFSTTEVAAATNLELEVDTEPAAKLIAESIDEAIAPDNSLVIIRLALVSFMATGWFLSRTFDMPIYLVLGLAAAAIGLDPSATEPRDHRRWIFVTLAVEVLLIIFVYLVVRLRH
jgi:hypothetical protein